MDLPNTRADVIAGILCLLLLGITGGIIMAAWYR